MHCLLLIQYFHMPTYDFVCTKCDHSFAGVYTMAEAEGKGVACPECGAKKVRRVYKKLGGLSSSGCGGSCSSCSGCGR